MCLEFSFPSFNTNYSQQFILVIDVTNCVTLYEHAATGMTKYKVICRPLEHIQGELQLLNFLYFINMHCVTVR
jgi:hypothetical protein